MGLLGRIQSFEMPDNEGELMELSEIASVRLEEGGVMIKYLLFQLDREGQAKAIVRGVNYQSYREGLEEQIVQAAEQELRDSSFLDQGGGFEVAGGGSITLNPYYETITLFGASRSYGVEQDREAVAKMLEVAYPEHKVSWFSPDEPKSEDAEPEEKSSEES